MLPVVAFATETVVTVKVAVLAPAAIVTLAGTVAAALALARVMRAPPGGASPFNVTVAVEGAGPTTVAGFNASVVIAAGVTVRFAVRVTPA
jgi:hypothetical protein